MNLAVNTTATATWKRLKSRYIATACGITLAVSAGVTFGGWRGEPERSPSIPTSVSIIRTRDIAPEPYTFYVVGSEQERDVLIELAMGDDFPSAHAWVVVVQSLADELSIAGTQAELTDLGNLAQVVDLRDR